MRKIQADTCYGLYEVMDFDDDAEICSADFFRSFLDAPFDGTIAAEVPDEFFDALDEKYTIRDKK